MLLIMNVIILTLWCHWTIPRLAAKDAPCCYGLIASRSKGVSAAYTIHAYGAGAAESDCISEQKAPSNSEHSSSWWRSYNADIRPNEVVHILVWHVARLLLLHYNGFSQMHTRFCGGTWLCEFQLLSYQLRLSVCNPREPRCVPLTFHQYFCTILRHGQATLPKLQAKPW